MFQKPKTAAEIAETVQWIHNEILLGDWKQWNW